MCVWGSALTQLLNTHFVRKIYLQSDTGVHNSQVLIRVRTGVREERIGSRDLTAATSFTSAKTTDFNLNSDRHQ